MSFTTATKLQVTMKFQTSSFSGFVRPLIFLTGVSDPTYNTQFQPDCVISADGHSAVSAPFAIVPAIAGNYKTTMSYVAPDSGMLSATFDFFNLYDQIISTTTFSLQYFVGVPSLYSITDQPILIPNVNNTNTVTTQLEVVVTASPGTTLVNGPVQVLLSLNGISDPFYTFSTPIDCIILSGSTQAISGTIPITSALLTNAGKYSVELSFPSSNVSILSTTNLIQLNLFNSNKSQILSSNFVATLNGSIYDTGIQPINTLNATTASAIKITTTIASGTFVNPSVPIFISLLGIDSPSYVYFNTISCITNPSNTQAISGIIPIDFALAEQYNIRTLFLPSNADVTTATVAIKVNFYNANNELLFTTSSQSPFNGSNYDTGSIIINTLSVTASTQARITLTASPTQIPALTVPVTLHVMSIVSSLYDYQTQIICDRNPSNLLQAISAIVPINQILLGNYMIQIVGGSSIGSESSVVAKLELFSSNNLSTFDQIYSMTQLITGEYDTGVQPITISNTTTATQAKINVNTISGTFNGPSVPVIFSLVSPPYVYFNIIYCAATAGSTSASTTQFEQIGEALIGNYTTELYFNKSYVSPGTSSATIELQLFNFDQAKLFDTIYPAPLTGNIIYYTGVQPVDIVVALVDITITTSGTFIDPFTSTLLNIINFFPYLIFVKTLAGGHTAVALKYPIFPVLTGGDTYIFNYSVFTNTITPMSPPPTVTSTLVFKDLQGKILASSPANSMIPQGSEFVASGVEITIACLHGDSIVQSKEGPKKIKDVQANDEVLTGENKFAKVLKLAQCWIQMTKEPASHDAIIFEPHSLGDNEPNERLIIDPGHPIATKADFEKHGINALKKAGEFIGTKSLDLIYIRKWDDLIIQTDPEYQSIRYDLILEEPHETYVANGIIVKSRESVKDPGYLHRYDDFV